MKHRIKNYMLPILRGRMLALAFIGCVFAAILATLAVYHPSYALLGLATIPLLGVVMPEEEFQTKVLASVGTAEKQVKSLTDGQDEQKSNIAKLLTNYDQLGKDTKAAMEELTKVKNSTNDLSSIQTEMKRLNLQMRREGNQAFGNPIKRICAVPEYRDAINAVIRQAAFHQPIPEAVMRAGAIVSTGTPGSAMIVTALANEIYDLLGTYGVFSSFNVMQLSTKTTTFPVATARPVALFLSEGGQIGADATKDATSVDCTPKAIGVLLYASKEMVQDSEFDLSSMVLNDFAQAYAYRVDWAALAADGTADTVDGGFTGIFAGGTAADAAAGNTTVDKLDLDDFVRCLTTVAAAVLRRGAKWWINPQILAKICLVRDANGRPIFQTALEAPSPGAIGSILGYPVIMADAAPSTDAASNVVATFGDPQGMVIGMRQGWEFAASEQFMFDYNRVYWRGIGRVGAKIRAATAFANLTTPAA
jgi:HK97 family phage major capsid protein